MKIDESKIVEVDIKKVYIFGVTAAVTAVVGFVWTLAHTEPDETLLVDAVSLVLWIISFIGMNIAISTYEKGSFRAKNNRCSKEVGAKVIRYGSTERDYVWGDEETSPVGCLEYTVDNQMYRKEIYSNKYLCDFVGKTVSIWVNPNNPNEYVLPAGAKNPNKRNNVVSKPMLIRITLYYFIYIPRLIGHFMEVIKHFK